MAWRLRTLVACMCWLLGLTGSIKLELGFIYLTLSGIAGILMSLEDDPGRSGPSAYSVFNPNNEQLAGTLDARHIDAAIKNQTHVGSTASHLVGFEGTSVVPRSSRLGNKPCHCGSGRKQKKCCGRNVSDRKARAEQDQWERDWT